MFQIRMMPGVMHYIVKTAFRSPILLKRVVASQTIHDEIVGTTDMRGLLDNFRFMPPKPTPFGVNTLLIWHTASDTKEFLEINMSSQFFNFNTSPYVILLNTQAKRITSPV